MKLGYLGPQGSFTNMAALHVFEKNSLIDYVTIPDCFDALMNKEVDYSIVPLENTLEGSVSLTIDSLFRSNDLKVVAEVVLPINQHLLMHPNQVHSEKIEKILSHSHALAQCHHFLHQNVKGASLLPTTSTSAAAEWVSQNPTSSSAAIGTDLAAKLYGLEVVKRNIHDSENNHTRFLIITLEKSVPKLTLTPTKVKSTIMVTLPTDRAGALHQVLSAFSWRQLNLSKIESRPLKTRLGDYFFIIDIEEEVENVLVQGALQEIEAVGCKVKVVGSYSSYFIL
ncbi:prephenate dehydratase [Bacillus sp. 2205SS5-2]|uniref:prephenate dehydratase n=1 Tax=Bacillus sp. 2205SS5-2 TaxID=3109031 RepID=UPI003FA562E1